MKKSILSILALASVLSFVSCQKDKIGGGKEQEKKIDLEVPSGLKLASYGEESIKMSWEAVENAEYYTYKIIAKVVHDGVAQDSLVAKGKTVNCFKTIEALDPKGEPRFAYWFAVAAGAGKISSSEYSSYVRCEPGGLTPLTPQNVEMSAYTDNGLSFKWDASEASDYYSYLLTNMKGEIIKEGDSQNTSITFDGLKKGRYYKFSVMGKNALEKSSPMSEPAVGLTYGEYIPALSFNVSFDDSQFVFEGGETVSVTDGEHTATYVVVGSGATATMELISEEEVEYNKVYTAYLPEAISDNGFVSAVYNRAADGTISGVPAWAVSPSVGSKDLVFHSYCGTVKISMTSQIGKTISKVRLVSEKAMSGYVVSATTGPDAKIEFSKEPIDTKAGINSESADGAIEYQLTEPVTLGATPVEVSIPVPAGTYDEGVSALFMSGDNIVSGNLLPVKKFEVGTVASCDADLKIIKNVESVDCPDYTVADSKKRPESIDDLFYINSYADIETGAIEDYDFGFLTIPYGTSDWTKARFVKGSIISSSATRAIFEAPIDSMYCVWVKACVKPAGTPALTATSGRESFVFFINAADPDYQIEDFPKEAVLHKEGSSCPSTTYSFYGLPVVWTSKNTRTTYFYYYRAKDRILSNKVRYYISGKTALPGYKAVYGVYEKSEAASTIFFIGTSSAASSYKSQVSSNGLIMTKDATEAGRAVYGPLTTAVDKTIYFGSDSNKENTKRVFVLFKKPEL